MPEERERSEDEASQSAGGAGGAEQSPAQPEDVQQAGGDESVSDEARLVQIEGQLATLQRAMADVDNRRKRAERMAEERVQYAVQRFAQDMLPVIDNFERGLSHAGETRDFDALNNGLKLVHDQLLDVLKRHSIEKIEALHKPFDPNHHEAVGQLVSDEHPDHTVIDVQQAGYQMHERTIRPSRVIISRKPADEATTVDEGEQE